MTPTCQTCSKPLAGRGKCKDYGHSAVGPLKVGTIVERWGYGRAIIESVEFGDHLAGCGFRVVERDLTGATPGRVRVHATPFNAKNTAIVSMPEAL